MCASLADRGGGASCQTRFQSLPVSFAAVADAGDLNGDVAFGFKEEAVVAAAESKVGSRSFELLDVAEAAG